MDKAVKRYKERRDARVKKRMDADEEGKWVTTEKNHKVHINAEGEPDKGNPKVIEKMGGGRSFQSGGKTWNKESLTKLWQDRGYSKKEAEKRAEKDLNETLAAREKNGMSVKSGKVFGNSLKKISANSEQFSKALNDAPDGSSFTIKDSIKRPGGVQQEVQITKSNGKWSAQYGSEKGKDQTNAGKLSNEAIRSMVQGYDVIEKPSWESGSGSDFKKIGNTGELEESKSQSDRIRSLIENSESYGPEYHDKTMSWVNSIPSGSEVEWGKGSSKVTATKKDDGSFSMVDGKGRKWNAKADEVREQMSNNVTHDLNYEDWEDVGVKVRTPKKKEASSGGGKTKQEYLSKYKTAEKVSDAGSLRKGDIISDGNEVYEVAAKGGTRTGIRKLGEPYYEMHSPSFFEKFKMLEKKEES